MQQNFTVSVNNVPEYAKNHRYIAVHIVDGELWFYGAFDEKEKAEKAASEYTGGGIPGLVLTAPHD